MEEKTYDLKLQSQRTAVMVSSRGARFNFCINQQVLWHLSFHASTCPSSDTRIGQREL